MSERTMWRQVTFEEMTAFAAGKIYKSSTIDLLISKRNGVKAYGAKWQRHGPMERETGHSVEFTDGTAIAITSYAAFQLSEDTWSPGGTSFWVTP